MVEPKKILTLSLCFSLFLASGFYILLTTAGNGIPAISETDQTIYYQYARNMAQGQPYVYSVGDSPSSGSTTHLYILALAALFKLGATGDLFLTASYLLNAFFYLGTITCVWLIAKKIAPNSLWLIMLLTVMSGQLASAALKQTDIGLFTLLALGLFASLAYERRILSGFLIVACAVTRPEGMVFALAFLICGTLGTITNVMFKPKTGTSFPSSRFFIYGILGLTAFGLTLLINYATTGHFHFMSVANKGYFNKYPLNGAIYHTLNDLMTLVFGFFGGFKDPQRQYYLLPYVSAALGFAGIILKNRKNEASILNEGWLALSTIGALLLIASSQFQGLSNDRYLAWVMPFWIIYICIGWEQISQRLKRPQYAWLLASVLILFQPISLIKIASDSYRNAVFQNQEKEYASMISHSFEPAVTFGVTEAAHIAYYIPSNKLHNLHGITSPDFFEPHSPKIEKSVDLLKKKPGLQFNYWIVSKASIKSNPWMTPFIGEQISIDADTALSSETALGIWKAKWETLNEESLPLTLSNSLSNMTLVDQIDIGYPPEEKARNYQIVSRLKNTDFPIIATTDRLGNSTISESGRVVFGSESFTIENVTPDKPVKVVMLTGQTARAMVLHGPAAMKNRSITLDSEIELSMEIDGRKASHHQIQLQNKGFMEVVLEIPAQYVQSNSVHVMLSGDHISYGYWFYQ